ncbi:FAD-dependent monooxygenase [Pseudonocardia nigra]|uniref:FAD-dependent monooxygenase n=1 Tax=Pseudonocardia nigra TaxID=1921578 RepID=UPI001C5F4B10|nr:FAD-dependent monooxygenase [Pseudonocardia nigra]
MVQITSDATEVAGDVTHEFPVVVVGGGPVGLTLALDLGWRGVPVLVLEQALDTTTNPRCNTINARSMEYFRRLGLADRIRRAGLPLDHPTDVVHTTALHGHELARFEFASSGEVLRGEAPELAEWPTPELQHRISQIFLEPILEQELRRYASVRLWRGWRVDGLVQDEQGVTVTARDTEGRARRIRTEHIVGCDGGASTVRKAVGVSLHGDAEVGDRRLSVYFRSEELQPPAGTRPGWMYWWYGPHYRGSLIQLDGRSLYLCHGRIPRDEDLAAADPDEILRAAIGYDVRHEKIDVVRWTPRRLVADRFRVGRVLLAGDAAHIWLPLGGFGMNTGIADAIALSWRLAAMHAGWGGDRLLDDYALERRSVGVATSQAARDIDGYLHELARDPELHRDSPAGAELRSRTGRLIEEQDRKQWFSQGVQFGARYVGSPGLTDSGDGDAAIDRIDEYVPSVGPGSRLPHVWRPGGRSVFDELGQGFTLLRIGTDAPPATELQEAAAELADRPAAARGDRRRGLPAAPGPGASRLVRHLER